MDNRCILIAYMKVETYINQTQCHMKTNIIVYNIQADYRNRYRILFLLRVSYHFRL